MTSIKKVRRKIIRLVMTGTLAGAQGALAGSVVHEVDWPDAARTHSTTVPRFLPQDVRGGSIHVPEEHYGPGLKVPTALVSADDAAQIAGTAGASQILSAELEVENGYLVWAVEMRDTGGQPVTAMIDAGTGELLALDTG